MRIIYFFKYALASKRASSGKCKSQMKNCSFPKNKAYKKHSKYVFYFTCGIQQSYMRKKEKNRVIFRIKEENKKYSEHLQQVVKESDEQKTKNKKVQSQMYSYKKKSFTQINEIKEKSMFYMT